MRFKKDNFWLGAILGLIGPIVGFTIFKMIRFNRFSLTEMYQWITLNHNLLTAWISVSLFANALLFTIFVNANVLLTVQIGLVPVMNGERIVFIVRGVVGLAPSQSTSRVGAVPPPVHESSKRP